jgi:hypothetical protein
VARIYLYSESAAVAESNLGESHYSSRIWEGEAGDREKSSETKLLSRLTQFWQADSRAR